LDIAHGIVIPPIIAGNDVAVLQGYARYIAPVGAGLTIDVGTFLSHIGSETVEGYEQQNATYSHGFIFSLFTPPNFTGLRLAYDWERRVQATVWVVNGWQSNTFDNNTGKTYGLQLNAKPVDEVKLSVSYLAGPEQPNDNHDWRQIVNAYVDVRPDDMFTARLEGTYGYE